MALVHVRKEEVNVHGRQSWLLRDPAGVPISVFSEFCHKLRGLQYDTLRRYTTVVARFIDYLYEVKVLGAVPVTRAVVNDAIDYYLELLRSGEGISLAVGVRERSRYSEGDEARETALRGVARRLGIEPLASASWDNTIAALNHFLRLCALLEREAKEMAILRGGIDRTVINDAEWDYRPLLEAVDGSSAYPAHRWAQPLVRGRPARPRGCGNGVPHLRPVYPRGLPKAQAGVAHCGIVVTRANSVRNRCEFQDTTRHRGTKKNRHRLGFPVCGGVLYGGAGGN